jgi:hypothetical protein
MVCTTPRVASRLPSRRNASSRPARSRRGRDRSRGVDLVVGDEHAAPAERGRGMHERPGARARSVKREPEAPQPAGRGPPWRALAVSHGKVLGKPCEEHVPSLITSRSRRVPEQSLACPCRLLVILLQELDDQPPSRVEVRLGRDEASKLSEQLPVPASRDERVLACSLMAGVQTP